MTIASLPQFSQYAVSERALQKWVAERLRVQRGDDGGVIYTFALSGSTCTNRPLEVVMTVTISADGRIESATAQPAVSDTGCDAMCGAANNAGDGRQFLAAFGDCGEVLGLTLREAAFREWNAEPSGCFCTAGNRRHKWRNVFQALHYYQTVKV
jgi:hypothetical protein